MITVQVADDAATAVAGAAEALAALMRRAVSLRGRAHVAVSGGSTPGAMFAALVHHQVPWERVELYQVDERIAPDGDPDRNATGLARDLLDPLAAHGHRPTVHLMTFGDDGPGAYARVLHERCGAVLDVVHLGIGDDAHTASWPPGDPVVDVTDPVAVSAPYRGHVRPTLTPPVVNAAREVLVLATGAAKAPAVARWLAGDSSAPVSRLRRHGVALWCDRAVLASSPR